MTFRFPHPSWQTNTGFKVRCLRNCPERFELAITAIPRRNEIKNSSIWVWHPCVSEHPARLLANVTKHNFQRRRQILGCGQFRRNRLEQTELLFAFLALLFRALSSFMIPAHMLCDVNPVISDNKMRLDQSLT